MVDDPTWYVGTVKCILHEKGFGFVACEECSEVYGTDAYLHSSQLPNLHPGMQITFRVRVNARGQPQALDATPVESDALAAPPAQAARVPRRTFAGHSNRPQTQASQDYTVGTAWMEAVVHGGAAVGVPVVLNGIMECTGDHDGVLQAVYAWLSLHEGGDATPAPVSVAPQVRPQKVSARYSPYKAGGGVAAPKAPHPETRYEGEVTAIKPPTPSGRPGFGFVTCAATKAIYGEDVFLHSTQAECLTVGSRVTFEVQINKMGRPQATNLHLADG